MRSLLIVCVAALTVLAVTAGFAAAADQSEGQVPTAVLSQVGLDGLQPMTDAQGEHVRGMRYVAVYGDSFVYGLGGQASNGYTGNSYHANTASGWTVSGVIQGSGGFSTSPFSAGLNSNFIVAGGASSVHLH